MSINNTGLFISICILIIMLVICHVMNYLYPRNLFTDITTPLTQKPLPTQYNIIEYDNKLGQIPCEAQAHLPCNILNQQHTKCSQNTSTSQKILSQYSDSELAIIYKVAYEQAGLELLKRTINDK